MRTKNKYLSRSVAYYCDYRVGQKSGTTDSWPYFCQILTSFKKFQLVNLQFGGYYKSHHTLYMLLHYRVKN